MSSMHTADIVIILAYLIGIALFGLWIGRKGSDSLDDYFLGGRHIPWFILGISGMTNFVDMGGTARQSAWYYLLGSKGFWVCLDGAVALLLSFQMIYAAKWIRRSECITNAEWMTFRFGKGRDGQAARVTTAVGALVICVAIMTFMYVGAVKVLPTFIPFFAGNEHLAGILFFGLVICYTVTAGFKGVIYTDLFQAVLIILLIGYVGVKAFSLGTPEYMLQHGGLGWDQLFPADGKWSFALPEQYQTDQFSGYVETAALMGVMVMWWLSNNLLQGSATPFDSWTAQRYFAARNESEASLTVFQWIVTWSLRFFLLAGLGVMALSLADNINDPEKAMSVAIMSEYIPVGIRGLLIAALLAAGMSTIDSTANSSASYFVKDIYEPFFNPEASNKTLVRVSHITTFGLMVAGILIGIFIENINSIWGWIMNGIFVGALPANIAKWFWHRTSGIGYMIGTLGGLLMALLLQLIPGLSDICNNLIFFTDVAGITNPLSIFTAGAVLTLVGSLAFPSKDPEAIKHFYEKTRPFGLWGKVRKTCSPEMQEAAIKENIFDMMNTPIAITWHLSLFIGMSSVMFREWTVIAVCAGIFAITSVVLYFTWFRNLKRFQAVNEKHFPEAKEEPAAS